MSRTSFADYQATRYFHPLDGLRALSAALVVTWHTRDSPLEFLQGERGVTVFFVLSGYLITMLALREEESKGALSIKGFFLRRVFRILPLYYVVLAAYAVLVYLFDGDKAADFNASLPYYLLYLSEVPLLLNEVEAPFNHSWSLGIEEKFYMVWPFLAFGFMKSSRFRLPMAFILGSVLLAGGLVWPEFGQPMALFEPYGHILIGAAMAFALHNKKWYERLGFLQNPTVYWLLGVSCVVLGVTEARWAFELIAYSTALFVGAMVLQPRHAISRVLGFGPLAWLGTLSYAVYLIHPAVLGFAERLIPSDGGRIDDLLTLVVGYALSVAISVWLHRLIEKPFIKWGRKFDTSRHPSPAPSPAPSPSAAPTAAEASPAEASLQSGASPSGSGRESESIDTPVRVPDSPDDDTIDLRDSAGGTTVAAGAFVAGQASSDDGSSNGAPVPDELANGGHAHESLSFARLPPAVAWGSGAWVEARGNATVRRSTATLAMESSSVTQVPVRAKDRAEYPIGTVTSPSGETVPADPLTPATIEPTVEAPSIIAPTVSDTTVPETTIPETTAPDPRVSPLQETTDAAPARGAATWLILGLLGVLSIAVLAIAGYLLRPEAAPEFTVPTRIDDVRVDGHILVDGSGASVRLQGVTQGGAQYACAQGWGIFDGVADETSAAAMSDWGINAVRLPLNEHCWLGTMGFAADFSGQNYQSGILDYVDTLRSQGHAVVISLDWSGVGDDALAGEGVLPNSEHSLRFWESVAQQVGDRPGVLFELFAGPETAEGACLTEGCVVDGMRYVGFQTLIDGVRATGSTRPIVVTAPAPSTDISFAEFLPFTDPLDQLIIGFKAVDGAGNAANANCVGAECWAAAAESASVDNSEATRPALAISLATVDCSASDYSDALSRLEAGGVSVFVPGWNTWDACGDTPGLLANADFAPTPVGEAVRDSFS